MHVVRAHQCSLRTEKRTEKKILFLFPYLPKRNDCLKDSANQNLFAQKKMSKENRKINFKFISFQMQMKNQWLISKETNCISKETKTNLQQHIFQLIDKSWNVPPSLTIFPQSIVSYIPKAGILYVNNYFVTSSSRRHRSIYTIITVAANDSLLLFRLFEKFFFVLILHGIERFVH